MYINFFHSSTIFNQKLKAIEEDIVPFGFIDDGSEQIKKIEIEDDPRQQWQIEYDRDCILHGKEQESRRKERMR